jgi:hypothetical protein
MNTHHEWQDTISQELVNEIRVELYAFLVDGVLPAAEGNNAGPGDGEAVGLDVVLFHELYVLFPELVRVRGDVTIASIEGTAWLPGELVPDAGAAAVDVRSPFNLEGGYVEGQ